MTTDAEALFFGEAEISPVLPPDVQDAIASSSGIRSLNSVATKVLQVLDDPGSSAQQIERAIEGDPGLTTRLMTLANSSFYGGGTRCNGVRAAVTRLGFETVKTVTIASAVMNGYDEHQEVADDLWQHSLAVAVMSRLLCLQQDKCNPELGFVAGLLHDIGKFFFLQSFGDRYARVHEIATNSGWDFRGAELEEFGCDHAVVGAEIAAGWGLHEAVIVAIRHHHGLGGLYGEHVQARVRQIVATVRLADDTFRCHRNGYGFLVKEYVPFHCEAKDMLGHDDDFMAARWTEFHDAYAEALRTFM